MKILVTGGAGFIGSNLVRQIIEETDDNVITVDAVTYAGNLASLGEILDHPRHTFERVNLCDPAALQEVFRKHRPDAVMHLAAESHVDRSIDGPGAFIQSNVVGTFHLLQAAIGHWRTLSDDARDRFRVLHVSTDEVYGSLDPGEPAFTESTPYNPHSPYSASKAGSDHLARAWNDTYGLPVLVTNCSNNYGPRQFPEKFIPVIILKCLSGASIPVYGNGENIRDWLHVDDHCHALRLVLARGKPGATYNIGGNNEQRNLDVVRTICVLLDELRPRDDGKSYAEQISFVTDRPGHDLRYAMNAEKIREELGWTPRHSHESGFRTTVEWYLGNESWWAEILNGGYRVDRLGLDEKAMVSAS